MSCIEYESVNEHKTWNISGFNHNDVPSMLFLKQNVATAQKFGITPCNCIGQSDTVYKESSIENIKALVDIAKHKA